MSAQDSWSSEEGCIQEGFSFGFAYASAAIALGEIVKFTGTILTATRVDGRVPMTPAAGTCDGSAIALKAADSGAIFPVLFYGIYKLQVAGSGSGATAAHSITAGSAVTNSAAVSFSTYITCALKSAGVGAYTTASAHAIGAFIVGNSHILGTAMQFGRDLDEILVLVGAKA